MQRNELAGLFSPTNPTRQRGSERVAQFTPWFAAAAAATGFQPTAQPWVGKQERMEAPAGALEPWNWYNMIRGVTRSPRPGRAKFILASQSTLLSPLPGLLPCFVPLPTAAPWARF